MIHLICGPIGAGKTTYAREIAAKNNAVRFSEDEWLSKLFVPDAPEGLLSEPMQVVGAWASERYQRCREKIWLICQQLLSQNISIVLDGAAANKEQRDLIRKKARDHNVNFQLHYVTSDTSIRKDRVFKRNKEQGSTYSLDVTPDMFVHTENFFEPPVGEELNGLISVNT
jgi:predicted kinase